ncbi:hypothetical protein C479_07141 [Halovivax asiaticus JCM 14624]|uniref:Uncharacterized protein n=1 Tax=Halovivax asiaticus JCM 14624 TaxID=1227490 RepID=M0BPU5_9EURY|nr:hypothetical protein C479_07141 [Halovivax asiaticus JCM 14624]
MDGVATSITAGSLDQLDGLIQTTVTECPANVRWARRSGPDFPTVPTTDSRASTFMLLECFDS